MEQRKWYAIYTRPRWEKKVFRLLQEQGCETYCPINRIKRQWSDRMKWVDEPLFKSYLFVRVLESEKLAVRMTAGVVNFVYWNGKPGIVKDREIEQIRRFMNEHHEVEIQQHIEAGSRVKIGSGLLLGREARVLKVDRKRVELVVETLQLTLIAYTDKTTLSLVRKAPASKRVTTKKPA